MKLKTIFQCQVCNYETGKWQGRCPNCQSWNSFAELEVDDQNETAPGQKSIGKQAKPELLSDLLLASQNQPQKRFYPFSAPALNHFFNQGLALGGLTLLAGEPGLGKSTLALQLLRSLYQGHNKKDGVLKLLYITAEESQFELARRSQRLSIPPEIMILQANNFEQIERVLHETKPNIVILDSIQTIYSSSITSNPGSVAQVATLASQLLAITKSLNITIIVIGHVTKEGQIAGPKTLEHLVDSVLLLESAESNQYRTLSFSKHRFGSTSGLLLLKMETSGLEIVTDPSLALLENIEAGTGVVYSMAMDKDLPIVVEIQALVSKANAGASSFYGRREALGLKVSKLNTILAIMEKYLDLDLRSQDIYIQTTGQPKNLSDDSLDLPILLAILSSLLNKPIHEILKTKLPAKKTSPKLIFSGRLTLSGSIRAATNIETRQDTAKKLGFTFNPEIELGNISESIGKILGKSY